MQSIDDSSRIRVVRADIAFLSFSDAVTAFSGNSRMMTLALKGHNGFSARNSESITARALRRMNEVVTHHILWRHTLVQALLVSFRV